MKDCKWMSALLPLIIVVFTLWEPVAWVKWLVVVSAIILLIQVFAGKTRGSDKDVDKPVVEPKVKK